MNRRDTETTCHCGADYNGSDHCPECGCEQYESGDCGHVHDYGESAFAAAVRAYAQEGNGRIQTYEAVDAVFAAITRETARKVYG